MTDTNEEYPGLGDINQDEQGEKKKEQQEIKRSWLWNLLDKLEDIEIRMIYGIFLFIFAKIPIFIKDILVEWFLTFLKFLKVILLLSVWILIISAPVIFWKYKYNNLGASLSSLEGWLLAINNLPRMIPALPTISIPDRKKPAEEDAGETRRLTC